MEKKRIAVFGCGFWANFQIPGWQELEGVEIPAVYNRTKAKAEVIAEKFNIPAFMTIPRRSWKMKILMSPTFSRMWIRI